MYQVNVFYNNKIEETVYNCKTIEEASKERYYRISKWFKIYEKKGVDFCEINDKLNVEIRKQE